MCSCWLAIKRAVLLVMSSPPKSEQFLFAPPCQVLAIVDKDQAGAAASLLSAVRWRSHTRQVHSQLEVLHVA